MGAPSSLGAPGLQPTLAYMRICLNVYLHVCLYVYMYVCVCMYVRESSLTVWHNSSHVYTVDRINELLIKVHWTIYTIFKMFFKP